MRLLRSLIAGNQDSIRLSDSQEKLLEILGSTDKSIFVTGKAGTGKSTVLREYKKGVKNNVVVTAPTGIAALNVHGQTIHSLFCLGRGVELDELQLTKNARAVLANIDVLIIDEVSMVRADMIDAIDRRLKQAKGNNIAFGGARLILFGDLYQLPPIVSDPKLRNYLYELYRSLYFFKAVAWKADNLKIYELDTVFRQTEQNFRNVLNEIRVGRVSQKSLFILNSRIRSIDDLPENIITLSSTNKLVDEINHARLKAINSKGWTYAPKLKKKAKTEGLSLKELTLKKGAKVMLTKNDKNGRYVNGSLGIIKKLNKRSIWIKLDSRTIRVTRTDWTEIRYVYNERARRLEDQEIKIGQQFPIKLAWAVTIHKSQGQTYENCAVDLKRGAFAHGQAYVALSRCKSLDGLTLLSPIMKSDITVDPSIKDFMRRAVRI